MVSPKPYGANSRVRGPEKERGDGVLSSEVLLSKAVRPPSTTSKPSRASDPGEEATPSLPACEMGGGLGSGIKKIWSHFRFK